MPFERVDIADIECHPFTVLDKDWALVTAGELGHMNTMTVSWGGLGTLWNKPVATVYIRPQRYTKQFVDSNDRFTLSFFNGAYKKELGVLGVKSGRDGDKAAEVGFTPAAVGDSVSFEQADLVLVCRKLYVDAIEPEHFIDPSIDVTCYPEHDYHTLYIAEVEAAFHHC